MTLFNPATDNPNLVDIYLHGPLGERFGEHHRMAVSTPQEAVRALDANYPGFVPAFIQHAHYGVYADGDWRGGEDVGVMPFSRELHFCPIIEGRAFLGVALVGAIFPGISALAANIIGTLLVTVLLIGISLLFMKKPKKEDEEKDDSFAFTGPENTTGQGVVVPLIYGRLHCGSVIVSAGFETTQLGTIQA